MLLGNNPDDYDVVTEATPDKVLELFKDCKVKQVGKSFGVILVEGYEVATFRHDRYKDSKCIVSFADTIHEEFWTDLRFPRKRDHEEENFRHQIGQIRS